VNTYQWIYLVNLIFISVVPVICYTLSTQAGHSAHYLSTISANYMHFPERLFFLVGVGIFVVVYYSITGLLSPKLVKRKGPALFAARLEILILAVFFTIAAIPAHLVLGLHATLMGLLAGVILLWIHTLLEYTHQGRQIDLIRRALFIGACVMAFGMIVTYPHQIIFELGAARADMAKRLHLLGLDDRWLVFAHFEWVFFYIVILFFASLVTAVTNQSQRRPKKQHRSTKR
jgi:hypothetical protein